MAHDQRETNLRPSPPEVPDEYALTAQWSTGPPTAIVAIEVYGLKYKRNAFIRLIDDAGSMDAGTVTAGGTDAVVVDWTVEARTEYGADWLDGQADMIKRRLAYLWGTA